MAPDKQHAHQLVEKLDSSQLDAVVRLLEVMVQDEELVTGEDCRRLHEGQAWFDLRGGKGIPTEDVLAEFGLRPDDFPLHNASIPTARDPKKS